MMIKKLIFLGGGVMAKSILTGLQAVSGAWGEIIVVDRNEARRQALADEYGVNVVEQADDVLDANSCLLLAVKPKDVQAALLSLKKPLLTHRPLIISVATAITFHHVQSWLQQPDYPIIRAMPNLACRIQQSATALCASENIATEQKQYASAIFEACGLAMWLEEESLINVVIALAGSAPAYLFELMHIMQTTAEKMGLSTDVAKQLMHQTFLGSSVLAMQSPYTPLELVKQVSSKGGTTEQAISVLRQGHLDELIEHAMQAAVQRAQTMEQQWS